MKGEGYLGTNHLLIKWVAIGVLALGILGYITQAKVFAVGELEIDSCTDLQAVGTDTGAYTGWTLAADYILTSNIDCSGIANFDPIADSGAAFEGTFDGQGFSITNLTINRPTEEFVALFAVLYDATITDVSISGSISGRSNVGSLAGSINDGGAGSTVTNVTSSVTLSSLDHEDSFWSAIGGIAGQSRNTDFTDCAFTGAISADGGLIEYIDSVGGIVGFGELGTSITHSLVDATITLTNYAESGAWGVGGLVGYYNNSQITTSWADVDISITEGEGFDIGGLVGNASGSSISRSYATGDISATQGGGDLGGLVGRTVNEGATITNSYATGNVEGVNVGNVGGLVGQANVDVINAYSTGTVTATGGLSNDTGSLAGEGNSVVNSFAVGAATSPTTASLGALSGGNAATFTNSFYDSLGTGLTNCRGNTDPDPAGCTGVNTAGSPSANFFKGNSTNEPMASWDFGTIWVAVVAGYPVLQGMPSAGGGDVTAPTVSSVTPLNTAINQELSVVVVVNFSEPMNTGALNVAFTPAAVIGTVWSNGDQTVTITPTANLSRSTNYQVSISAAADLAANNLTPLPYTWSFITKDVPASVIPASPVIVADPTTPTDETDSEIVPAPDSTETVENPQEVMPEESAPEIAIPVVQVPTPLPTKQTAPNLDPNNPITSPQNQLATETLIQERLEARPLNLGLGSRGEIVRILQQFLNAHGYTVSPSGAGSPGRESTYFGLRTKLALIKFQRAVGIPATGLLGPLTRSYLLK